MNSNQPVPQCSNVTNPIVEVLLTAGSVEDFYQKRRSAGPLTDSCTITYQEIATA